MNNLLKKSISAFVSLLIFITGSISQTQTASAAALGADFTVTVSDLQFILQQIRIAESHKAISGQTAPAVIPSTNVLTAGRDLIDPRGGTNANPVRTTTVAAATTTVLSPLLPEGLRQTDGRNNNLSNNGFSPWLGFAYLTPANLGQSAWGAADTEFPRLVAPSFRPGYETRTGNVIDPAPRVISNLISDQTVNNPAAIAAANCIWPADPLLPSLTCKPATTDNVSLSIQNRATNAGVAASYNGMFALFGQFFDHGLDLVGKSSIDKVRIPLATTDPLYDTCIAQFNRGCVTEFQMGRTVLGNDPATAGTNTTTPWIDQNQTYTSHPSHQVFLREYKCANENSASINQDVLCTLNNRPIATGRILDGAVPGNIANWAEVKKQAANKLGIELVDMDIHDVPLLLTDEYGMFLRSSTGFPQIVESANGSVATVRVGNPGALASTAGVMHTGHAFLNDISHFAAPAVGLLPDANPDNFTMPPLGFYDDELLNQHFITGDGRGNENIGLTAVHTIFHAEHNRLWSDIQNVITNASTVSTGLSATALADFKNAWKMSTNGEWNGERLFHASKLITEMEYQHLVFGEFARKVQPLIKPFVAYDPTIRPDISGEFAHAVYRYGHSQLNETVDRTSVVGTDLSVPLLYAFLNPTEFNQPHSYANPRSPDASISPALNGHVAAGSIVRGMTRQTGNEIDEFVTGALRNSLLGLPLDLATLNIARGRDAGIPSLNSFRNTLYTSTGITSLAPYGSWAEFGQNLRHPESLVNFIAAYGVTTGVLLPDSTTAVLDPTDFVTSYQDKRIAAQKISDCFEANQGIHNAEPCVAFMTGSSGLNDIDLWVGGLAENNTQFGTMLGTTFDYVFKNQLERLQESDRFYYLGRLAGLNLSVQIETNFFSDIIMRNTDVVSIPTDAFAVPTYTVNMAAAKPSYVKLLVDGTWMYTGTGHILWNGTTGSDRVLSDRGDDSIYGDAGNDWLRGGAGNDFIQGGEGNDVLEDSAGANVFIGGNGNDYMSGSGTDAFNGNGGNDFISGGTFPMVVLGGIGNDWIRGGTDNDTLSGDDGDDWLEGNQGGDLIDGDVLGAAGITLSFPGNDILIGNTGDDLLSGFDGSDIYVPGAGTDLNTGGLGFDWSTYYNDGQVGGVTEDLANFAPAPGVVLANLADQFQEIEGLSGGDGNDTLAGTALTTNGAGTAVDNSLRASDCTTVFSDASLTALLPATARARCSWDVGDILVGGAGSDIITGGNGNDLIDGDAALQTWISIPNTWVGILNEAPTYVARPAGRNYVSSMLTVRKYIADNLLGADVISDLQIVRTFQWAPNAGANDVAVYQAARANYTIVSNADGTITVTDARAGGNVLIDGADTLRNIETLRFTDGDVLVSTLFPVAPTLISSGVVPTPGAIAVTWTPATQAAGVTVANFTARAWTTAARAVLSGSCTTANATTSTCTINAATGAAALSGLPARNYFVDVIATTTSVPAITSAPSAIIGPIAVAAINPATPTNLAVTRAAAGAVSGQAFTTQPIIQIRNSVNNPVALGTTVTATVTGGATLTGTTFVISNAVTGAATFTDLGITGTPGTPYTITYTITVPSTIAITSSVTPTAPTPAITPSTSTLSATAGTQIATLSFAATNFSVAPTTFQVSPSLPAGLIFSTTTGAITGTPNAQTASAQYVVTATSGGQSASSTITVAVAPAAATPAITPSTSTLSATAGTQIATLSFAATNFSVAPTTFQVSPSLPAGLIFSTTTGAITGTPNAQTASAQYVVTATSGGQSATSTITVAVAPAGGGVVALGAPANAPTNVLVTAAPLSAVVSWGAVTGATRYTAQAYASPTSTTVVSQCSVAKSLTTCTIPNLQKNLTYYVDVLVRNASGVVSTLGKAPVTIR